MADAPRPPEALTLPLAGEPMVLLADRALYWPARRRLLVADLHLGKGNIFRAAGIPVPTGGTAHDLRRLEALLTFTDATSLWVLGDFLHGRRHAAVEHAWHAFRAAHARVAVAVVLGNHDRALDPGALGVEVLRDGVVDGPFVFRHDPAGSAEGHVLCGHVHPVVRVPGLGRWPLFWRQPGITVLPAFSAFTGGHAISAAHAAGSVACNGQALVRLERNGSDG